MNKQMKQSLGTLIAALVEKDTTTAKASFHDYLRLKTQQVLIGESVESEEDEKDDEKKESECAECDCDPCECEDMKDDKKKSDKDGEM